MGRQRWTTRLTVEECFPLDVGQLVRAGALTADPRVLCSSTWQNGTGTSIRSVTFRVFPDRLGRLAVHLYHLVQPTLSSPAWIQQQVVAVTMTKCYFGGVRQWLRCPLVRDGNPCGTRVKTLYARPYDKLFGCRKCLDLTYKSVQEHDKRIDWLLKLPVEEFNNALATGTFRQRLLAVKASTALLLRMERKAERFRKRRRNSTTQAVFAKTDLNAISG